MSTEPMPDAQAGEHDDRAQTVADLAAEIDDLRSEVNDANQSARKAKEQMLDLRKDLMEKDQRISELEDIVQEQAQTINQLRDRTGLLETVKEGSSLPIEQRAAVLIQVLHNKATENDGQSALDYNAAEAALGGSVNRSNIYRTMDKAEELVDNADLVRKVKEDKSSKKNTRLVMDLSAGELPATVAGKSIGQQEGRRT